MSRPTSRQSFRYRSMIPVPIRRDSAPQKTTTPVPLSLGPQGKKHAAIREDIVLTPEEFFYVNKRIQRTLDIILPWNYRIQGPGPKTYILHANLGVALVADIIIRPITRPCSLGNPVLKKRLRDMADDPTTQEFRHTYLGGKVWFFLSILDTGMAKLPLLDDTPDTPRTTRTPCMDKLIECDDGDGEHQDEESRL
ncbi:hypothetical protein F4859DRAFT_510023 [Xylaria cf. heliscus]|nr:hypothetical protein F4859DRAFT_510023 [Xylaria cf. heliscus]